MTLDRLLGKITIVGSLALSSLYCGSNDAGTPCKSDVDCKGENRICEKGECVDYTPMQAQKYTCEDVFNKYLSCCNQSTLPIHYCKDTNSSNKENFILKCNYNSSEFPKGSVECIAKAQCSKEELDKCRKR